MEYVRKIKNLELEIENLKADIYQLNRDIEAINNQIKSSDFWKNEEQNKCNHFADQWFTNKDNKLVCSCGKII
jgi:peptidoglycan hydrolase CwlO-like protein